MRPTIRLLILGKQGAGKGTQAARVSAHYGIAHISTGDIFRDAARTGTDLGRKAGELMGRGELVPDDIVVGVVAERLAQPDAGRGFILDGCPRTRGQAEALEEIIGAGALEAVIEIEVATSVVMHRLSGRRVCEHCGATYHVDAPPEVSWICDACGGDVVQRADDTEDAIGRRLAIYEEQTRPLTDFYAERGLLRRVDGGGAVEDVFARIVAAVESALAPSSGSAR